jgi:hypothetical protein
VTLASRHAVGVVRAGLERQFPGDEWCCEREVRESLAFDYQSRTSREHLPNGVVLSTDHDGCVRRTAIEVELTRKTEVRPAAVLRRLLDVYDDVIFSLAPARRRRFTGLSPRWLVGEWGGFMCGPTRRRHWPRSLDRPGAGARCRRWSGYAKPVGADDRGGDGERRTNGALQGGEPP